MKFFTPPLVNQRKKSFRTFFFGQSAEQKHYRATHYNENITLLWLEASQFGKLHCFPCVLQEGDGLLAFQTFKSSEATRLNAMLVQRWNLFVNPENIKTDYHVEEMTRRDFYELFHELRRRSLSAEQDTSNETPNAHDAPPEDEAEEAEDDGPICVCECE
ncbi:MAG: hypothetical protein ABT01_01755 [Clostridium sp. SCN 57-10]|nr:MAG: hypothetical protein ABT01_01755 [Clostridium sp. SCN 57-10]